MRVLFTFGFIIIAFGLLFQHRPEAAIHAPVNRFSTGKATLKTGDVVLRSGKGFISDMFRKTSLTDNKFSHAGILIIENDKMVVYHMLGTNGKSGLVKEPLHEFCNSTANAGYAVYRYDAAIGNEQKAADYIHQMITNKPKFDEQFNLKESDALYCTEMIYQVAKDVYQIKLPTTTVKKQTYIALDNLYLNPYSNKIIEFTY